jgi:septal ring factor EnvC (AmiA/AmiB activator)
MKRILLFCLSAIVMVSCAENSAGYKKLQNENVLLRAEKIRIAYDMEDMISTLNDIHTNILSIREAENYLNVESSGEMSVDQQTQIKNNILLIAETLRSNRAKLATMEEKLKSSDIQSAALQKTIERLNAEINQKAKMIASLQEDLAKKDIRIRELDEQLENLTITASAQARTISMQDKELHMAYYCFGTKKELQAQAILTGGGIFSKTKVLEGNFNRDYFLEVDTRANTEIQLYSRKAKIQSNHPDKSYIFHKDVNGNLYLSIVEPELFWSLSRYLVIEVG